VTWEDIALFGKSYFIRSFSIWFVLTPLFAKILARIEQAADITVLGYSLRLDLDLPFSWIIFYFCSLFFAIANVIFILRCPHIVKRYSSFCEFRERDNSVGALKELLRSVIVREGTRAHPSVEEFVHEFATPEGQTKQNRDEQKQGWEYRLRYAHIETKDLADAFAWVFRFSNVTRGPARMLCALSYAVGVCLLGVVFLQNILFVISATS